MAGGEYSSGYLTFGTWEKPTSDITIPEGSLAGTVDGKWIYQTTEEVVMQADYAASYYDASDRRYKIRAAAVASGSGADYDVAPGRVINLLTPITGISGVTNEWKFEGGTSTQTKQEFARVIQQLFLGNTLGTAGGMIGVPLRLSSSLQDIAVVTPGDSAYEGLTNSLRMAFHLYVLGQKLGYGYHTYSTVGNESRVILPMQPVVGVSSVLVDGVAVSYSLEADNNPTRRGSWMAQDAVVLTTPPGAGHSVYVVFTYNAMIQSIQSELIDQTQDLFNTSILVRKGKVIPVEVELTTSGRTSDVEDAVLTWFRDPTGLTSKTLFIGYADPDQLKTKLQSSLGITVSSLTKFRRMDQSYRDVEVLFFDKHEVPSVTVVVSGGE